MTPKYKDEKSIYAFIYFNALASKDIKTNENDFEII